MSLDHDLGGPPTCSACVTNSCVNANSSCKCECHKPYPDGSSLVRWMATEECWPTEKPVVHSNNPVGAAYMAGVIEQYGPYKE